MSGYSCSTMDYEAYIMLERIKVEECKIANIM